MILRCPDCDAPVLEKVRRVAWVTSRVYVCALCRSEWSPGFLVGLQWPEDLSIRTIWLPKEAWQSQASGDVVIVRYPTHYAVLIIP